MEVDNVSPPLCPSRVNYLNSLWTLAHSKEKEDLQIIKPGNGLHERSICGPGTDGMQVPPPCIRVAWASVGQRTGAEVAKGSRARRTPAGSLRVGSGWGGRGRGDRRAAVPHPCRLYGSPHVFKC